MRNKNLRFLVYLANTGINVVASYLIVMAITSLLSLEQNAHESMVFSMVFVLAPLLGFCSVNLLFIDSKTYGLQGERDNYLSMLIVNALIASVLLACLVVAGLVTLPIAAYALVISFLMAVAEMQNYELIFLGKDTAYALVNSLLNILRVGLTVALLVAWPVWHSRMFAVISAELVVVVVRAFVIRKGFKFNVPKGAFVKDHFRYGWPLLLGVGAAWMTSELSKMVYYAEQDLTAAGILNIVTKITNIFIIITTAYLNSEIKNMFDELRENTVRISGHIWKSLGFNSVMAAGLIGVLVLKPSLLVGGAAGLPVLLIVLVVGGVFINSFVRLFSVVLEFRKKTLKRTLLICAGSVVSVALLFFFKNSAGVLSYGVAYLGANVVMLLLFIHFYLQEKKSVEIHN